MPLHFHLDESVPKALALGLRHRGIDVTTTVESSLLTASDEEQLAFAYAQLRTLITRDQDFFVSMQKACRTRVSYIGRSTSALWVTLAASLIE